MKGAQTTKLIVKERAKRLTAECGSRSLSGAAVRASPVRLYLPSRDSVLEKQKPERSCLLLSFLFSLFAAWHSIKNLTCVVDVGK